MFEFMGNMLTDLHPMIVHFPIALLIVSFIFDIVGHKKTAYHEFGWILFVWGGLSGIPAVVTGLIAHLPYEKTASMSVIQPHEILGMLGLIITIGLFFWRWQSRRKGKDIGQTKWYIAIGIAGMLWIFFLGGTGGNLVYEYGINIRGIIRCCHRELS
jgi:uncharacterized membrane protein